MNARVVRAGAVCALLVPAAADAQSPQVLDALLNEMRLLRRAIERQTAAANRTQLLVGRVSLQDQRVARTRATVERLDSEVSNAEREQRQMRIALIELQRAMSRATEPRRGELEHEMELTRARLRDDERHLAELQLKHSQAKQLVEAETARLDELESWLNQTDRELDRQAR